MQAVAPKMGPLMCPISQNVSLEAVTTLNVRGRLRVPPIEQAGARHVQGSVWGSGLAGMLCAVAALVTGAQAPWQIGFVASFASKLSDTVSSEIGKVSHLHTVCLECLALNPYLDRGICARSRQTLTGSHGDCFYNAWGCTPAARRLLPPRDRCGCCAWECAAASAAA